MKQVLINHQGAKIRYGRSRTSMYRDERDGLIPTAILIRGRKHWLLADLDLAYGVTTSGENNEPALLRHEKGIHR